MYQKSIFIFRRDFRLWDNKGLIEALKKSDRVLPIFIFDPKQIGSNPYKSNNAVQFMIESLHELDAELRSKGSRLFYFYGKPHVVIEKVIKNIQADAVYFNMDYTLYSVERDQRIEKVCQRLGVDCHLLEDYLLHPVGSIRTGAGEVYTKFTPYFNKARKVKVDAVEANKRDNYISKATKVPGEYRKNVDGFYQENEEILERGGRSYGLKKLGKMAEFKKYNRQRNNPNIPTTQLSAYIKFGCVSIREVYWAFRNKLGMGNDLVKQLYWREFYFNVGYDNPRVYRGKSLKPNYDKIQWSKRQGWLRRWQRGETGFPIVDAGMRQMNTTGFMHNRLRLITSNFLVKVLLIDWREGEKYFSRKLMDIDWSVNNGNWQWTSSSGADSQPYFRIFNPWLQSKKYDPDAKYIKRWVPELADVDPKHIHQWDKYYQGGLGYPEPIVDYSSQKKKVLQKYEAVFK